jgi:amino acid transporter
VLAPVYIFYGFEPCGDIAEETQDAGRRIPRAMRLAPIWGHHVSGPDLAGVAITVLSCLLVFISPKHNVHIGFIISPANVNALLALVSFA